MSIARYDVLVVGAGPAGSVAAAVLARGGARVALLDKATFPRDKACGDLIGPRGVQLLIDLRLPVPAGPRVGPMLVVGPTGRRVRLPNAAGLTYPDHGLVARRADFDADLQGAAVGSGATPLDGRADEPLWAEGRLDGFRVSRGQEVRADFVIGADGATSRVAAAAGLVDAARTLWGFAIRAYHPQPVDLPAIVLWEPTRWQGYPGYGWLFPGADGGANLGLGVGTLSDRHGGSSAVRALPAFLAHLARLGLLDATGEPPAELGPRLGGWLKMGMVGTRPAAGRVLLVGDAAGLVNPLQGEGISQAMESGRWAAEAILESSGRGGAAGTYRGRLAAAHLPYQQITATLQRAVVGRPRAVAALARVLTSATRGETLAGGWAVFWNELLDGAPPGGHRTVALAATRLGQVMTARTSTARWLDTTLRPLPSGPCRNGTSPMSGRR